jgi:hypothetical protein
MNYKYKLVENDEEGKSSRLIEEPKVTLIVKDVDAALNALDDIKNYGKHAVTNARQDSNVNKSLEQTYGPSTPAIKNEQEKLFATKSKEEWISYFAEKKRKANLGKKTESPEVIIDDIEKKYDTLKNNNGKYPTRTGKSVTKTATDSSSQKDKRPTLLPQPEIKGNKIIFNKTDDGLTLDLMKRIIKTVMDTAKIDYKFEGDKEPKKPKPTKESKEKELRSLIREEVRSILKESTYPRDVINTSGDTMTTREGKKFKITTVKPKPGSSDFYYDTLMKRIEQLDPEDWDVDVKTYKKAIKI